MSNSTASAPVDNDTMMAALATIPLVGLVMFFAMKDLSDLTKFYAKQSIGLFALAIVLMVLSIILGFIPIIGWCLSMLVWVALGLLWLVLLINALQGKKFRTPLMSDMLDQVIK